MLSIEERLTQQQKTYDESELTRPLEAGEYSGSIKQLLIKSNDNGLRLEWTFNVKTESVLKDIEYSVLKYTTPLEGDKLFVTKIMFEKMGFKDIKLNELIDDHYTSKFLDIPLTLEIKYNVASNGKKYHHIYIKDCEKESFYVANDTKKLSNNSKEIELPEESF